MKGKGKNYKQVIDWLHCNGTFSTGVVEVNATNKNCLTALDVLLSFPTEAGDAEIMEILQCARAMRARDIFSPTPPQATLNQDVANYPTTAESSKSPMDRLIDYFKFRKGRDSPSNARNTLLVIAILIATTTYQAGLGPPGGVWQDNSQGINTTKAHVAGKAVIIDFSFILFGFFVFFNSVGFFVSLFMINILTSGFPLQLELQISMLAMIVTYSLAMSSIIPPGGVNNFFTIISFIMPSTIPFIARWVRVLIHFVKKRRESLADTNHNGA